MHYPHMAGSTKLKHFLLDNHDAQEDCSQVQATVHQIFHDAQQDCLLLQDLSAHTEPDAILTGPTMHI